MEKLVCQGWGSLPPWLIGVVVVLNFLRHAAQSSWCFFVLWEPSKEMGMSMMRQGLQVEMMTPSQAELVSYDSLTTLANF